MKAVFLSMFLFVMMAASAQNPISWAFTSKKLADNSYEIKMVATIEKGWHLYSQKQPDDAVINPTTFTLAANPLLQVVGSVKETGKLEKFHDKELNISANQYSEKVEFVQIVKVKGKVKTSLNGSVEYQTCDDKKCLPPKTVNFKVALD